MLPRMTRDPIASPTPPTDATAPTAGSSIRAATGSSAARATPPASGQSTRLLAIDWMRGLVMVLMAVDHASQTWNAGRVSADSAYLIDAATGAPAWIPGSELDLAQFLTRFITHLCAPTFLFLSGTSLAISLERRRATGVTEGALDRHLLIRAGVLFALEGILSLLAGQGVLILQVLWAIGASMLAMIALRRLPTRALLVVGIGWLAGSELVLAAAFPPPAASASLAARLFLVPGLSGAVFVLYPMTHWLAMMLVGWAFGRHLLARREDDAGRQQTEKILLFSGLSALLVSLFLRRANGYGNLALLRDDASLVQWLHMSKYPPALVYSLLELGLMALLLVLFFRAERRRATPPQPNGLLLVLGQTALFFYFVHFLVLGGSAFALTGGLMQRGLAEAWLAAAATVAVLYPVCRGFRTLKRRHPNGILQYF